jgi:ABC-type dipeptide/oligopeptide/nickel transport system permease subunit
MTVTTLPFEGEGSAAVPLTELHADERRRLWTSFALVLWPLAPAVIPIYALARRWRRRARPGPPESPPGIPLGSELLALYRLWLTHPFYVVRLAWDRGNARLAVAVLLLAPFLGTSVIAFYTPIDAAPDFVSRDQALRAPAAHPPMGTDALGRPLFGQIAAGSQHSYLCGLLAVLIAMGIGVGGGRVTDRRRLDGAVMMLVQLLETIPVLILLMVSMALFSERAAHIGATARNATRILVIGGVLGLGLIPPIIRLVRGRLRAFARQNFVAASKAHGISHRAIVWRHIILENTGSDLLILAARTWGAAVLIEISLGYVFSIGAPKLGGEPYASWAWLLLSAASKDALIGNVAGLGSWWLWFFPALFTIATVMGFTLFGDGLKAWERGRKDSEVIARPSRFESLLRRHVVHAGVELRDTTSAPAPEAIPS